MYWKLVYACTAVEKKLEETRQKLGFFHNIYTTAMFLMRNMKIEKAQESAKKER